jgi:hypothetical protein
MKPKLTILLLIFLSALTVTGQTEFNPDAGKYNQLLNDLKSNLYKNESLRKVELDGQQRQMFITWVRDHIHTMKAYKYWEKDMGSYIAFFMGRANPKGMYFDYCNVVQKRKRWPTILYQLFR